MKNTLKISLILVFALLISNCKRSTNNTSSLTGLSFNDPKNGNYVRGNVNNQKPPLGMVAVEGGSFTMGQVQDDVMFDWNTTPRKLHVRSFFMDEAEVTNSEYFLYVQYMKDVFPPSEENYRNIYSSVLPDTLVWRKSLGNTDILSENYFRHPAYADYPVVGVSWLQANEYCKWRTNVVNLKTLIDKGYVKNIFEIDSVSNFFDTDVFLADDSKLFNGDSTIYKRGIPNRVVRKRGDPRPNRDEFQGRKISQADGILTQRFRLPTEAEWEFAAKANIENREYNNIRGRKKYAWDGKYTRSSEKRYRGDQLANFKQGNGEYSGLSGWSSDGSDIPNKIKSYPPNAFGLYDMSGNVAEWVADVYRPIIDNEANDFNYFRGNIFTKKLIDAKGNLVYAADGQYAKVDYDTLPNGKIIPKELPGTIKYIPITKDDAVMRRNFSIADNSNIGDGDLNSSRFFNANEDEYSSKPSMYNSPKSPIMMRDSITGKDILVNDAKKRTTLISDNTRVYKGGSWSDREYWLDPAQRRYLPEYMATNYIGFRCVSDKLGPMSTQKKSARNPSR
ncbi:MAG: gliding motility lipoprotein GldJ [Flavobacteriia bacterium]|nr:gliding motility lipoprotein GldJ [Flavobacteriia bacterium]OIP48845.1 MAG: gliding motility lipoprotein GldJ [Flavobacteriaceae bacterium CG2_30_31_66]PIV96247.1 MAG: gliding motility lipoprotein GldJ [Flavobacteriaceae bacterium CG17_big_fil_post_rev_8_21_14_2_50_31_13]PIX14143.1 MAG: gliding motility lipoprotein GldJ [Flavobacteriaceae bacterium CG_4_8_14_3_um_filter_31_8]PIY15760.1 MAG: gliding motility lipoprotein GldJ [Flavobacteriaceae bacterium CG_4_10_14_3_um_filter_31_253]PIZ10667